MDLSHLILVLLRGCHLVAMLSLFGTLVSLALVAPAGLRLAGAAAVAARARLVRLARWSGALALLTGVGWMVSQAAIIAGVTSITGTLAALGSVLPHTQFGHLVLVRFALLLAAFPLLGGRHWRLIVALVLVGAALAIQGGMGHAGAAGGAVEAALLPAEALHLLAAGSWLGGLLPLLLLVGSLPPRAGAVTCHNFTPVGVSSVLLIGGTAFIQAWQWIGGLGSLFGTAYGRIALLKLGVFFALLVFSAVNRFVLIGRPVDGGESVNRRLLRLSIALETFLGALIIIVAALLASGVPATHEAAIWPFSRQPSLETLYDPYGRSLLLSALLPSLISAACVLIGCFWRLVFWPALAAFVLIFGFACPGLVSLLTIEAYPTTFVTSPTEFADSSITHGAALFAANCAICHGTDGRGDGPAAKSLSVPPADLTAPHFWAHTEGDLFWYITHGMAGPIGAPDMPAFDRTLSTDERWALVDFLKAHNAGWVMRATGRWSPPIQLPQFDAICADGSAINLDDLRGRMVHIIAASGSVPPPPAVEGLNVATIVLSRGSEIKPLGATCVAIDRAAWNAFAILLGEPPDTLTGTQVLADQNGWLRVRWRPGDPGDWTDPKVLATLIGDIAAHPIAGAAGGGHVHHR
jgi:putative copper export protein/mono/diheme cytochrome c family protein